MGDNTELFVMKDVVGGEFPGDFRNDFIDFGWDEFDDETKFVKRSIELNQGRAAMSVSISFVFCKIFYTLRSWFLVFGYTGWAFSPSWYTNSLEYPSFPKSIFARQEDRDSSS